MNQHVTRRTAFTATTAIAASVMPAAGMPAETGDERVMRLANELSEAMNGFFGSPHWIAHVGPSMYPNSISFSQNATDVLISDPLADLIAEYRAKTAEFEAIPHEVLTKENEEDFIQATYGPVAQRLYRNPPEPTSLKGVAEALRHAIEDKAFCDHGDERLIVLALEFLDRTAFAI